MSYATDNRSVTCDPLHAWLLVELIVFAYISDSDIVWPSMKPSGGCKKIKTNNADGSLYDILQFDFYFSQKKKTGPVTHY